MAGEGDAIYLEKHHMPPPLRYSAADIFGHPDTSKLKSSMTLFAEVAGDSDLLFSRVLDRYFQGERDGATLAILERFGEAS